MQNPKNLLWLGAALILLSIGCGDKKQTQTDQSVFLYNQSADPENMDPAFARSQNRIWPVNQMFNGLVQLDERLNIKPCIAKSWDVSDDGRVYTFNLRTDVLFHPHEAFKDSADRWVTAEDVVYSLERVIDPKLASPGATWIRDYLDPNGAFNVLNDSTLQISLAAAFRPFLSRLTMQYFSVVPKEVVDMYGPDFGSNPIGTGPFMFKSRKEGVALVMVKNPDYFEFDNGVRLPHLDGIKVSFIENARTAYLEFAQGNLHFLSGLDESYVDDLLTAEGDLKPELEGKVVMNKMPYLNTEYLGFNMALGDSSNNPLLIPEIRQAINYGFNRDDMMLFLRNGNGTPAAAGIIPEGLPSYDAEIVKGYTYDPEKAKELLIQAGYPGGKGLPEITLYTNESYKDLGGYIVNQLAEVGIPVQMEFLLGELQRERMAAGDLEFFRGSWIADYPDGENYLSMFYSKNDAPPNYTRFNSPEFDALYEQALAENNDYKRYDLYHQMDMIIIEQAPIVPLYYDEVVRFTQPNVEGLQPNGMNLLVLKYVKLAD